MSYTRFTLGDDDDLEGDTGSYGLDLIRMVAGLNPSVFVIPFPLMKYLYSKAIVLGLNKKEMFS